MPKRVLTETVSTHALIEQVPDGEETSITVPDVYETYINSLAPGERPIPLNVAQESHALRSITIVVDNREEVEGIIDPGSQIIAMSEAVCHDIGLRPIHQAQHAVGQQQGRPVTQSVSQHILQDQLHHTVLANPHHLIASIRHPTRSTLRRPH
jgi:hypothetical protein